MSVMVWVALIFLVAMIVPLAYYGGLAIRSFVRASREAGESIEGEHRSKAVAGGQVASGKAEAGTAKGKAAAAQRQPGEPASARPARPAATVSASEQADVEKVLAELESKGSGGAGARIRRNPNSPSKAADVQHRTPGATGDSGHSSTGGGA